MLCCHTVTFKTVQCHPGLTYIFNFWHSGTLALSPERQSAWMSENKNVGKTRMALHTFINLTIWCQFLPLRFKGLWAGGAASVGYRGCQGHPKNLGRGVWYPQFWSTLCTWLVNCTTGVFRSFYCSSPPLIRGLFSPYNAPKPFDGRALSSTRPPNWLQGVAPGKGKGKGGRERKGGRGRMGTPSFWNVSVPLNSNSSACIDCRSAVTH